jgi:calcium-dependent protein kinase
VKAGKFQVEDEEWHSISAQAIDLVHKLLEYDPSKRISAAEALQHDWILEKSVVKIDTNLARKTLGNLKNFSVSNCLSILIFTFREIQSLSKQHWPSSRPTWRKTKRSEIWTKYLKQSTSMAMEISAKKRY